MRKKILLEKDNSNACSWREISRFKRREKHQAYEIKKWESEYDEKINGYDYWSIVNPKRKWGDRG